MSEFTGVPEDAVAFYRELVLNNEKAWWEANKSRYATSVREPIGALVKALEPDFGEGALFRPHRDVRFSKDKSPYKDRQGAWIPAAPGIGWYVQIDWSGLKTAAGIYAPSPPQLARLRAAVADDAKGRELEGLLAALREAGLDVRGEQLKTKPKGYPADHPRLELLRHKSLVAWHEHGFPEWLDQPEAASRVRSDWDSMRPLVDWLAVRVGSD
ncbi:DUF2461 domain-containing protein [Segniliparus rugosus]|uniref:TIGR02453 family protein n=1 Tax=Segniliparus rugosus (strain ATCC BAA-974 / DSM 45345 / CCUG 50838 / CIP 108380 / JCM 13579 / CDC 945) TaxID=679197 RepID=E5XKP5_SEGRC|nr:DUF2461 domain-containing protein [Segniliparus rugosus]EFV15092.1 TIGR02453 family protein [Segniliparus rugosus ATCC BAA-974]